jgi:DNA-binding transcriptional ArsR family regulator
MADVLQHGAPITTKHVMTLAVLAGTVYFGHAFWREVRAWRFGTALGCTILFLAGTTTCVLMSAGRNAEVVTSKVLAANSVNTAREAAQKDRDEARLRYQAALTAEESECSSGSGSRCQSRRITRMVRREEYDAAEATLRAQKPEAIANSDIRAAAELLSRLPYVTANVSALEALLQLAFPFLQSLFCEIGAIVGFAIGLGHRASSDDSHAEAEVANVASIPPPVPVFLPPAYLWHVVRRQSQRRPRRGERPNYRRSVPAIVPATVTTVCDSEGSGWIPMSVDEAREKARRVRAGEVFEALREAGRPISNDELARLITKSKAEASRRSTYLDAAGLIQKHRQGRYVAISLRPLH